MIVVDDGSTDESRRVLDTFGDAKRVYRQAVEEADAHA